MATLVEKAEKVVTTATTKATQAKAKASAAKAAAKAATTAAKAKAATAEMKSAAKKANAAAVAAVAASTASTEAVTVAKAALKDAKAEAKAEAKKVKDEAAAAKLLPAVLTDAQNDMAQKVNDNQVIIVESGNSMIMTAIESGHMLIKLKAAVKKLKKDWMPWQKENLVLSNRQSTKYMKLASGDPKVIKQLLESMGEDASINAICGKIGQLALTDEEVKEREEKAETKAKAKAEANVMDINDEAIDRAIAKCTNIDDLKGLIEHIRERITEIANAPLDESPAEEADDDDGEDMVTDAIGDAADIADHVDPIG